ncbi:API5A inhibitor, partial [Acromyrmex heyeri]
MSTDSIEKLYRNFGILADAKDKLIQHEKEYLEILTAVKGSPKEKRLASQFIARFFKHFPKLADQAIDAHLDLCEDEDMAIRKQAIKDLPALCKDNKEHTARIADILAQLLQAEDPSELAVVHNSIMSLMKSDPKGTLSGFFSQIISGDDGTRERCIKFLAIKLKAIGHDIITKEPEDLLIVECKKVLQSQIDSSKFVSYICVQVLPHLSLMTSPDGRDIQLELLKLLAELTVFCGTIEKPEDKVQQLYNTLIISNVRILLIKIIKFYQITYMPLPPATEITDVPKLQFSHVECLMYAFHKLCKQTPEFLIKDTEQLKEFRLRLQYFARGIQGYIKKLREAISGKTEEELKSEENQLKVVALKTTNNINTLIKDLFHSPPSFKSIIHLSWKTPCNDKKSDKNSAQKRHTPITFGNDNSPNKRNKEDKNSKREIYTPPSGKYSSTISNYGRGRFKGNRPRGRGGFRTRGRGSWRKNFY